MDSRELLRSTVFLGAGVASGERPDVAWSDILLIPVDGDSMGVVTRCFSPTEESLLDASS